MNVENNSLNQAMLDQLAAFGKVGEAQAAAVMAGTRVQAEVAKTLGAQIEDVRQSMRYRFNDVDERLRDVRNQIGEVSDKQTIEHEIMGLGVAGTLEKLNKLAGDVKAIKREVGNPDTVYVTIIKRGEKLELMMPINDDVGRPLHLVKTLASQMGWKMGSDCWQPIAAKVTVDGKTLTTCDWCKPFEGGEDIVIDFGNEPKPNGSKRESVQNAADQMAAELQSMFRDMGIPASVTASIR